MTETNGFLAALAAVQAEAPALPKDKTNPHFHSKYTSLDMIVEKVGPLLTKHGLVWITKPSRDEHGPTLDFGLVHVDTGVGERGTMPLLLTKTDSQGLGSALTYARRYALCSVLNLVSDDDDDGNSASRRSDSPGRTSEGVVATEKQVGYLKKLIKQKKASVEQLNFMLIEVGGSGITVADGWTERLPVAVASGLIEWLKERPLPDPDHRSDVPSYGAGDFTHPQPDEETLALAQDVFGKDTAPNEA